MTAAVVGLSHSPLIGKNDPEADVLDRVATAVATAKAFIADFTPDLVVLFAPDHYNGFFYKEMPPFCLATEAHSVGDFASKAGQLSVDTEAVPLTLRVGAVVDVWVTPDRATDASSAGDGAAAPRSELVFDDVAVLSVPRTGSSLGPTATRQVIVGVGRDQQSRLPTALAALAGGTVLLTAQR